jgi:Cys-rich repeat protein
MIIRPATLFLLPAAMLGVTLVSTGAANAAPTVGETTVIGPFTGEQAPLHPDNLAPHRIEYYGTDLGWTYEHQGQIQILFGDTMANEIGDPIEGSAGRKFEDSFGSIDLGQWNQPETFTRENMPLIRLGQNPDSAEMAAINPGGHSMEGFKTPVAGFSNGANEFGVFFTFKPQGCATDADCASGARCDTGLGSVGPAWNSDEGVTFACVDGSSPACNASTTTDAAGNPVAESGFCNDPTSTIYAATPVGRTNSVTIKQLIGTRDTSVPKLYSIDHVWQTNKFMNPAVRTVTSFTPPAAGRAFAPDYRPAAEPGTGARVFVWGRPHFIGVNAAGRGVGQYFAYVDLPAGPGYAWQPQYFAGLDEHGLPRFSPNERDAAPADLDDTVPGVQANDPHDIVDQVSIAWIPELSKWLMIYGGGMVNLPIEPVLAKCGVLQLFAGDECTQVVIGNGAFRMRTADHPWGPWTPPQDVLVAGDPAKPEGQYGPGGMLRHPDCTAPDCAPHTAARDVNPREYGFFYAANIIEQWTRPAGDGVDLIWNASTWDPYRVILLRTRINR